MMISTPGSYASDGEQVFQLNCTACHKMGMRLVGPDLTGVTARRSEEWIRSFILNSQKMIADGDADAVAIFEEFNKVPMTPFEHLADTDIDALMAYLGTFAGGGTAEAAGTDGAEPAAQTAFEYTDEMVAHGMALFQGGAGFSGGGPSCIACHNVTNNDVIPGGLLAKDLTNVYGRMGSAGVAGLLGAPPFPAMTSSYRGAAALTEEEIADLTAFFAHADEVAADQLVNSGDNLFYVGGIGGLILIMILIAIVWAGRIRASVKKDILDRQLRSI